MRFDKCFSDNELIFKLKPYMFFVNQFRIGINFRRRLFREVEKTVESAEAMLQIAFISFIINYL
ncbi:MAG: hypothetical protein OHK0045_08710 [Raineya sp.]